MYTSWQYDLGYWSIRYEPCSQETITANKSTEHTPVGLPAVSATQGKEQIIVKVKNNKTDHKQKMKLGLVKHNEYYYRQVI